MLDSASWCLYLSLKNFEYCLKTMNKHLTYAYGIDLNVSCKGTSQDSWRSRCYGLLLPCINRQTYRGHCVSVLLSVLFVSDSFFCLSSGVKSAARGDVCVFWRHSCCLCKCLWMKTFFVWHPIMKRLLFTFWSVSDAFLVCTCVWHISGYRIGNCVKELW